MKTGTKSLLVILVLLVAVGIAAYLNRPPPVSDSLVHAVELERHPVQVAQVRPSDLSRVLEKTGVLRADMDVVVTAELPGRVRSVHKTLGDPCAKDELLIQLDKEGYQIGLAQAQAAYQQARIGLDQANRTLARIKKLKEDSVVSPQEYETSQAASLAAEAGVRQAEASLRLAQRNVRITSIRCPFDGHIAERLVDPGQEVNPSIPLARVVSISQLILPLQVSAAELTHLRASQPVDVIDSSNGAGFQGVIARLGVAADAQTKTFPVEIAIAAAETNLRPGQIVTARCELERFEGVLSIPVEAVRDVRDQTGEVMVVDDSDAAREKKVLLGPRIEGSYVVRQGLTEGDRIIVVGSEALLDGALVEVIPRIELNI